MTDWHPLDKDDPPPPAADNSDVTNEDLLAILGGVILPQDIKWRRIREENDARFRERMANLEEHLQTINTRELLRIHASGRAGGQAWIEGLGDMSYYGQIEDTVRKVLATRPHVPNKKEGSVLRRKAAKAAGRAHHGK